MQIAADARTVAAWTLISRLTGFGRAAVVAAVLGPTFFANLFQTTSAIPAIVNELLVGALIASMLVPRLVPHVDAADRAAVRRIANGFLGTTLSAGAMIIALCSVIAPIVLDLLTVAVADAEIRDRQAKLGWPMLALLMPQVFFYAVAATGVAVQQAHGRFSLAAAAPAAENVGIMAVMAASALLYGTGPDIDEVTMPQIALLTLGSTAAVGAHAALQWWGAFRLGIAIIPRAGWLDSDVRRIFRLAVPSAGFATLNSITYFALLVVAGAIPGGTIAFQIGYSFFNLPAALCARPLAAAQLPRLARNVHENDLATFQSTYESSLALAGFITLPATFVFVGMHDVLASVVSFGEMGTYAGMALVAAAVGSLGAGIVGDAVFIISTSASYARRDAIRPLRAMAIRAAIAFAGMVLATTAMHATAILWTLGLSVSAANLVGAAYLHHSQTRVLPCPGANYRRRWLGDLAVAALAALVGVVILQLPNRSATLEQGRILLEIAAIVVGLVMYLLMQWARGSHELRSLLAVMTSVNRQCPNRYCSTPNAVPRGRKPPG